LPKIIILEMSWGLSCADMCFVDILKNYISIAGEFNPKEIYQIEEIFPILYKLNALCCF